MHIYSFIQFTISGLVTHLLFHSVVASVYHYWLLPPFGGVSITVFTLYSAISSAWQLLYRWTLSIAFPPTHHSQSVPSPSYHSRFLALIPQSENPLQTFSLSLFVAYFSTSTDHFTLFSSLSTVHLEQLTHNRFEIRCWSSYLI